MSVEFHNTYAGRMFYEHHFPQLTKQLEDIGVELKRSNDLKKHVIIKQLADEIAPYDCKTAQILDVLAQSYE